MGRPFVAGNNNADDSSKKTEIMNMASGNYEWESAPDFPYLRRSVELKTNISCILHVTCLKRILRITYYGTVSTDDAVYIISNYDTSPSTHINKFYQMQWIPEFGYLKEARHRPAAYRIGNDVLVIGCMCPGK